MVDAHLRSKTIDTADIKNLIIGGQTGIDGIRFCLAAVTNGENLADPSFSWFLQYKNKNGQGESVGLTPVYENGLVKLSWVPNSLATQVSGRMQIQLYAAIVTGEGEAAVVTTKWVSEPAVIYIQENLNPSAIVATEPSVFDYYLTMYASYKEAAKAWASEDEDVEVEGGLFSSKHYSIKAAALYALFNNRFLGAKAADPTTDNDGNALVAGAVYFNTTSSTLRVFSGSDWGDIANGAVSVTYTPTEGMESSNVQDAIDELNEKKATQESVGNLQLATSRQEQSINELEKTVQSGQGATVDYTGVSPITTDGRSTGRMNVTGEGNTLTNMLPNSGTFAGWGGIVSIANGWAQDTATSGASALISAPAIAGVVEGNKYALITRFRFNSGFNNASEKYVFARFGGGSSSAAFGSFIAGSTSAYVDGTEINLIAIVTASAVNAGGNDILSLQAYNTGSAIDIAWKEPMIVDLTTAGLASIPSTADLAKMISYFDGTQSLTLPACLKRVGRNLCPTNPVEWELGSFNITTGEMLASTTRIRIRNYIKIIGGSAHKIRVKSTHSFVLYAYDANHAYLPSDSITAWASSTNYSYTPSSSVRYVKIAVSLGLGGSTVLSPSEISNAEFQIQVGAVATPYEPYDSQALVIQDTAELHNVPAIADQVLVQDGEWWRRGNVQKYVIQASDITSLFTSETLVDYVRLAKPSNYIFATIGASVAGSYLSTTYPERFTAIRNEAANIGRSSPSTRTEAFEIFFEKGTYATLADAKKSIAEGGLAGTIIYYQLATPTLTKLHTIGSLSATPSCTISWEGWTEDSYQTEASSQITLPHPGAVQKVFGYDEHFQEYEVPASGYTQVGTALTITGAEENEVWYVQQVKDAALYPAMTVNTLNNDKVIADTANGKYYKLVPTITNGALVNQTPVEVI